MAYKDKEKKKRTWAKWYGEHKINRMSKQEEIREGIARELFNFNNPYEEWNKMSQQTHDIFRGRAGRLLSYLHSQGVAIKVEKDIPTEGLWMPGGWYIPKSVCDSLMDLATEPLIEVKHTPRDTSE